ncbi:MAG: S-layer homology domain-containing protein, partial [Clostridia bacterium]|nr:S-layer homology domain-containing protein [Clostridia bacterium]
VAWAQVNNITEGVGGGRFAPDEAVTREQFVTLLWRYAMMRYERGYEKYRAPQRFGDADPVSDWAQDAMCIAIYLENMFKWYTEYEEVRDCDEILLAGEEKT